MCTCVTECACMYVLCVNLCVCAVYFDVCVRSLALAWMSVLVCTSCILRRVCVFARVCISMCTINVFNEGFIYLFFCVLNFFYYLIC